MKSGPLAVAIALMGSSLVASAASAGADNDNNTLVPNNKRLNDGVLANVYTVQHQAGCTNDVKMNRQLQTAAQWHSIDVLNNRALGGDLGSDGSSAQSRSEAAGFRGQVAQTVAINPALAINGVDIINRWYHDPVAFGVMSDCSYTEMGVWSVNSLDRSVVVAVYGRPE
ncbi:CAP domain-containing protein [Mycolicibacterium neoaurum]|uniref:CAP domain-containing protein n=1 Tax=Mycolicibacterium neoaurum TaxID=1795 RepID=UPI001BCE1B4D|nr:CAP domain-containing protein [Mycolicibacterium neoaurum]QVI27302.1 CAP domain-containing protein [Mycolicibacterium neoaurum]